MGAIRRGLGLVGFSVWNQFSPTCTQGVVETRTALEHSSRAVSLATDGGSDALCAAYRRHVVALEGAARVSLRCGAPRRMQRNGWSSLDAETAFYRRLVAERCS